MIPIGIAINNTQIKSVANCSALTEKIARLNSIIGPSKLTLPSGPHPVGFSSSSSSSSIPAGTIHCPVVESKIGTIALLSSIQETIMPMSNSISLNRNIAK